MRAFFLIGLLTISGLVSVRAQTREETEQYLYDHITHQPSCVWRGGVGIPDSASCWKYSVAGIIGSDPSNKDSGIEIWWERENYRGPSNDPSSLMGVRNGFWKIIYSNIRPSDTTVEAVQGTVEPFWRLVVPFAQKTADIFFESEEHARRVAKALRHVALLSGAKEDPFR